MLPQMSKLWYDSICTKSQNRQNQACSLEIHSIYGGKKQKTKKKKTKRKITAGVGTVVVLLLGSRREMQFYRCANLTFKGLTNRFLCLSSGDIGACNYSWNCNVLCKSFVYISQILKKQWPHPFHHPAPQKRRKINFLYDLLTR